MLFSWLKNRRRRRLVALPFPLPWSDVLSSNVAFYHALQESEQLKLCDDLRIFISETDWEGCGGLELTDEIKVTVAAQACILTLALSVDLYRRVQTILVYPSAYVAQDERAGGLQSDSPRLGEAHYRGPVILSWDDVLHGGRHPHSGQNLVFHEFAHQLDMLDGSVNGTPPLRSRAEAERWQQIMTREFRHLRNDSVHGHVTLLDQYGAQNEGEFFAVCTESFFTRSRALKHRHHALYELFRDYFKQDPAAWSIAH